MILESYEMKYIHDFRRNMIGKYFSEISNCDHDAYLSLWDYIDSVPIKFFSQRAYKDTYEFLKKLLRDDPNTLCEIFEENEGEFNALFKKLSEINSLKIHDDKFSSEIPELMLTFENEINPSYLKLIESVYSALILPMAIISRNHRGKSLEGLEVYSRNEEIKKTKNSYMTKNYSNTIRNSIAHGKVGYQQFVTLEINYQDKSNFERINSTEMVMKFDSLLDLCNGMCLGYKVFILSNLKQLKEISFKIPQYFMIDELRHDINAPGWEVQTCIDSKTINDQSQLMVYSRNKYFDYNKITYYLIRSAIRAELFAQGYNRYFISFTSKYALRGWAVFNGSILQEKRINKVNKVEDYEGVLESLFYWPNFKMPRLFSKLSTYLSILRNIGPAMRIELSKHFKSMNIDARYNTIHRNQYFSVVNGATVICPVFEEEIKFEVRNKAKKIVRKTIKYAKRRTSIFNTCRYLPVGYIKISVLNKDFRKRKLMGPGLIPELICTMEFKRFGRIKGPDIKGGTPEWIGKVKVVWNKNAELFDDGKKE